MKIVNKLLIAAMLLALAGNTPSSGSLQEN